MKNPFEFKILKYQAAHSRKMRWQKLITILASVVVFCSTYALVLPSITWERQLICEVKEHTHDNSCYQGDVLVCQLPEHVHSDSCYDAPPAEDDGYYCGHYEHVHDETCYYEDGTLCCSIPEHVHTLECEINRNADVEIEKEWIASFENTELIGNWASDVVAIANTQLGYKESEKNFEVVDNSKKGYTRYGAWANHPYDDWSASFCGFVLNYAGVDSKLISDAVDCSEWIETLSQAGRYYNSYEYSPKTGDMIFFNDDTMGFVTEIIAENGKVAGIKVIAGDYNNQVAALTCSLSSERIIGYGQLPETVSVRADVENNVITLNAISNIEGNYHWQWQSSKDGQSWEDIPEANSMSYTFNADNSIQGNSYHIVGKIRETTTPVYMTESVNNGPKVIVSNPVTPVFDTVNELPSDYVLMIAGSDFQDPATSYSNFGGKHDYTAQVNRIKALMGRITKEYGNAYGFIGGGDYNFDETKSSTTNTKTGVETIRNAVRDTLGSNTNIILVQGNHDAAGCGTSAAGNNDTAYYGVFVMNENDYRSYPKSSSKWSDPNQSEAKAAAVAKDLDAYLSAKVANNYDKPVFIVSHVPLHYSTRTVENYDGIYADVIYDVIYKYAEDLNIIFLYGHNHAWGDDDYLGGSSVFLTRGDSINIAAHGDNKNFNSQPLNFTYMNYGYTGYYWAKWVTSEKEIILTDADNTLTMTAFLISGNSVTISRWDEAKGMHDLKSVGAPTKGYRGSGSIKEVCPVTKNTYSSPQMVGSVEPQIDPDEIVPIEGNTGILSTALFTHKLSAATVTSGEEYNLVLASINNEEIPFIVYDIKLAEGTKIPDEGIDIYMPVAKQMRVFDINTSGKFEWLDAEMVEVEGKPYMHIKATHFSIYGYAGLENTFQFPEVGDNEFTETVYTYTKVTSANDLRNGDTVIIQNYNNNYLTARTSGNNTIVMENVTQANAVRFTVEKSNGNIKIKNGSNYVAVNTNNGRAIMGSSSQAFTMSYSSARSAWQFSRSNYYLYAGSSTAARASNSNNIASQTNTRWNVYKVVESQQPAPYRQLAVTKLLSYTNNEVTANTPFVFRLTYSTSGTNATAYNNSTAVANNTTYRVFNYNGDEAEGTYRLSTIDNVSGCFTLLPGQTAVFAFADNNNNYFVSERTSADIATVTAVSINSSNNRTNLTVNNNQDNTFKWVNAPFETISSRVKQGHVEFTNTPAQRSVLQVKKVVEPVAHSAVTSDTEFTFCLSYSEEGTSDLNYAHSTGASGSYKLYDSEGTLIGEYNLTTDNPLLGTDAGCFTLKDGQYAVFDGINPDKYYFLSEKHSSDIRIVTATNNNVSKTVNYDSTDHWISVDFASGTTGRMADVVFTNTPVDVNPSLDISLQVSGSDENVPANATFNITVVPENFDPDEFVQDESVIYQILENYVVISSGYYDPSVPFVLKSGQSISITGLDAGNYVVTEELGDYEPYIISTITTVNNQQPATVEPDSDNNIIVNVDHQVHTSVSIINKLPGAYEVTFDFGDGQTVVILTDTSGHIPAPWPTKSRAGLELIGWRTERTVVGVDIANEDQDDYVFTENTTLYAHWVPWTVDNFDRDATVTKKIRTSTAYRAEHNIENVLDIDLDCYLPTTEKMGVVLILDVSSSMDTMCLKCGHYHSSGTTCPNTDSNTGYDGSSVTSNNAALHGSDMTYVSRITTARQEANTFLDRLYGEVLGKECWVQVILFSGDIEAHSSCVNIGSNAIVQNGRTAVEYLKNLINTTGTGSGTNIAQGIHTAYLDLQSIISDHGVRGQDTYAILLSDGAPTTNYNSTQSQIKSYNYNAAETAEYMSEAFINKWMYQAPKHWSQYDHFDYDTRGWTGFNNYDLTSDDSGLHIGATSGSKVFKPGMILAPPYYADKIRDTLGSKFYSVMFGHNQDRNNRNTADNWKYVAGIGIDNQDYIASFSDYSTQATSQQELSDFYDLIINSVQITCENATITDPMSDDVEFLYFTDDEGNIIEDSLLVEGSTTEYVYRYDEETRTIIWNPTESGYLHYKVRVKNEEEGFEDYYTTGKGTEYKTNNLTTFQYSIQVGNKPIVGRQKTIDVPYAHGWLAVLEFTKYGGMTETSKHIMQGVTFTLEHDPNCPYCNGIEDNLHEVESRNNEIYDDQLATIETFTAVSNGNGLVRFANIPSGHTYILKEQVPENYIGIPESGFRVEVYHDENPNVDHAVVVVTPTGDYSQYWDVDNSGRYTLFNLQTDGIVLPETGGTGTIKIYIVGTLLMMFSALCAGFSRKRRQ